MINVIEKWDKSVQDDNKWDKFIQHDNRGLIMEERIVAADVVEREKYIKSLDPKAVRALCIEFDIQNGDYPEHEYEGAAVFQFLHEWIDRKGDMHK